jgi:hypothetical protein
MQVTSFDTTPSRVLEQRQPHLPTLYDFVRIGDGLDVLREVDVLVHGEKRDRCNLYMI